MAKALELKLLAMQTKPASLQGRFNLLEIDFIDK